MPGSFTLSKKAIEDLSAIWEYTIQEWFETQADKYYFMLLEIWQELADEKLSAKQYPEIQSDILGTRAGQHIIFFQRNKKSIIEVLRILHSRMDLPNRLSE